MTWRRSSWAARARSHACAKGAVFIDHTTVSATIARQISVEAEGLGAPVRRCPGDRRTGGRGKRHAGDHVRRHQGGVEAARPDHEELFRAHRACRRPRRWPDHQDGQPDLHRRRAGGLERSDALCPDQQARSRQGVRRDLGRRSAKLADGQPLEDDGRGQLRLRLCGRLDAQGPGAGAGRGAQQRRVAAGRRPARPILCRSAASGRRPPGYQRADSQACRANDVKPFCRGLRCRAAGQRRRLPPCRRADRQRQRRHARRQGQGRELHRAGHRQGRQGQAAARTPRQAPREARLQARRRWPHADARASSMRTATSWGWAFRC